MPIEIKRWNDFSATNASQTAANAGNYLAPYSPYRNEGTTAIDPGLLAQIQTMTTYTPQDGGYPDNDGQPDLGYHYSTNANSGYVCVPDWWILEYYGSDAYNATNVDCNGNTLLYDYTNGTAPAVFSFTGVEVASDYVRSFSVPVQLDVTGHPYYVAVAVDDTNYQNDATWSVYAGTNMTVNLGSAQGWHDVWIGLRGYADNPTNAVWQEVQVYLDLTPRSPSLICNCRGS
jgi:hypothetical protein